MILFPAVDIQGGRCVRLKQGVADQATVFSDDPAAMAEHWEKLGAEWLHVVDLDGAFSGEPRNKKLVADICSRLDIPVQLGGGVRSLDIAKAYIDAGVSRLLIGTMALEEPETFAAVCQALPGKTGVSLDAVDGALKTKGWVADSGSRVLDVVPRLTDQGAAFFVYTDIARDGMHSGVNTQALTELVNATELPVVAAGGVSTMADVEALAALEADGLQGVITGRAIYEGTLDFAEAAAWLRNRRAAS